MSNREVTVGRAEADDPRATLKAQVEAELAAALDRAKPELAVTGATLPGGAGNPANRWEIFARGPYLTPGQSPGRIIMKGQKAYIATIVWLNKEMLEDLVGWGGKIELHYFTSNTQTMKAIPELDYHCCIHPVAGKNRYVTTWEFTAPEAACVLETNICARVCNCTDKLVPFYAGFVRWVENFDPENLYPMVPGLPTHVRYEFDRPIRYMVVDPDAVCDCSDTAECK
jgi:hypothetical protein